MFPGRQKPIMLHFHHKLPTGGAALLLAALLCVSAVQAASLPRHYRLRGGDSDVQSSPDMMKALEYIENLKQRNEGRGEPADYDEVEKFRVLLQLATQQQQDDAAPGTLQRQDITAEQLMKTLLRSLQGEPRSSPATSRNDRRAHRHRTKETETPQGAPVDYSNTPRAHKKYPLMFEDEENTDASKRATEDLDEQYTPQSLANLRSIFDELGRMPMVQKRAMEGDDEDQDEDVLSLRSQAYEDVAGGEEWVPVEEREETEELTKNSREEVDRAVDPDSEEEVEEVQRRANQEEGDDDTKLVDYYLLKVLEMSDQSQRKRDLEGEQKKRLIRPSIVDPRTVKELLELSLKLHVPPQDLIDMLLTEELRKLHREPHGPTRFSTTTGQTPKIRYFSRRLPVKSKTPPPEDMDREDFLDIIGVETISNEYPVIQRPMKTFPSSPRITSLPALSSGPVRIPPPSGRRENLFLSELNKMPLKRQTDTDDEDDDVEDEVTTYLAAKILTEYPNTISKRDTQAQLKGQFPYELYEKAMKDYLDQNEKRPVAKRETEVPTNENVNPTEMQKDATSDKTQAPQTNNEEGEEKGKVVAGM
ncbi:secretogranin-2b [Eucyclogobius newberryi]|uniref:secretogranin-2b n=1 Tax=Eucyclogobius newberryi TaxID=166745 RepID=UPI003B5C3D9E